MTPTGQPRRAPGTISVIRLLGNDQIRAGIQWDRRSGMGHKASLASVISSHGREPVAEDVYIEALNPRRCARGGRSRFGYSSGRAQLTTSVRGIARSRDLRVRWILSSGAAQRMRRRIRGRVGVTGSGSGSGGGGCPFHTAGTGTGKTSDNAEIQSAEIPPS